MNRWGYIILLLAFTIHSMALEKSFLLWEEGRKLFYSAVADKKQIDPAIEIFRKIMHDDPQLEGRALTYIGALEALKGKHAFFPHDKYRHTLNGLFIMDQGLAKNPQDIESLFIHATTCYFLPFFFHRHDDAKRHFRTIIALLPESYDSYDPEMVHHVIDFISEKVETNAKEQEILLKIKAAANLD